MESTFFTVFTSTYNRKHTIHRVWESLINQTDKNFEWIVIDNGSQDDIKPLLEEYKAKADFNVITIYQENQGKYTAFDQAIELAKGELIFPADSDDRFVPNTIERFNAIWQEYKADDISGIDVLCEYKEGGIVGEEFPFEGVSTYKEINYKFKVGGEKWGCVRVDILKKYEFPSQFSTTYFPDMYIWAQIGFNYKTVYINEALRIYYQDAGNQITHKKDESVEYMSMKFFFSLWKINYVYPEVEEYISYKEYFRLFVFLWITAFKSGTSVSHVLSNIERWKSKIVALVLLVPSYIIKIFGLQLNFLRRKKYKYQTQS